MTLNDQPQVNLQIEVQVHTPLFGQSLDLKPSHQEPQTMGQLVYPPANSQCDMENQPWNSAIRAARPVTLNAEAFFWIVSWSTWHANLPATRGYHVPILCWTSPMLGSPRPLRTISYVQFRKEMLYWEKRLTARPFWKTMVEVEAHTNQRHFVKGSKCYIFDIS